LENIGSLSYPTFPKSKKKKTNHIGQGQYFTSVIRKRLQILESCYATDKSFLRFQFSLESLNFIIGNKHCYFPRSDRLTLFIQKHCLPNTQLNNQSFVSHSPGKDDVP
jgi:hypothetical protein